ncbi:hypothetical protein EDD21DRAFT_365258 [Dissophora ornata]|nr:hypothetical protein BGZ58_004990 [Dissophora ornata]KAI8604796.1 hypothetical protein EDD21DRAFT_365258 [Dissophora ornata]
MRHQPNSPRKVIAVDLDEVLARTTLAIAEFHNDTYGTSLTMDDFVSYDYTKVWGGTREESIAKWRLFFDSPYFLKVEPVEGSLETLKLLKSRRYSLVIVTARQQFVADLTKKFVDRHFPGIFESIYFANHFLTEQEKMTFISKPKSVICRDVCAQLLIDDSLENAAEVARAGIPVLLFDLHGAYKWNKLQDGQQLPDKVTRVKSWKEVQAWFPRPRSPLSTLCISRDDQISEDEESDPEDDEEDEDDQHMYGVYQHQPNHRRNMDSDSDSDEDLDADDEDLNEIAKREQEEEEGEHHGRTLRRRKLMMMDFSSSEDDEDIDLEHGENMDSDEADFDLESGRGARHISHEDLERYRHQHETMYTGSENGMEMEMEMEMETTTTTQGSSYVQVDVDDMERGLLTVATSTTTTTALNGTTISTTTQVSIAAAQVDCQSLEETTSIPVSPEAIAVEGLTIKSPPSSDSLMSSILQADKRNMEMEEVPLA